MSVEEADWEPVDVPEAFDLAAHLDRARAYFSRFVVVDDPVPALVALWAASTYVFEHAPALAYLHYVSPEPGSGKTLALEVTGAISYNSIEASGISGAVLFRLISTKPCTMLLDEVDAVFGNRNPSESAEVLRQTLNAGYVPHKSIYRFNAKTNRIEAFQVYGPKALAGLKEFPGSLAHRSLIIPMRPALVTELDEREDFDLEEVGAEAKAICDGFQEWADLPSTEAALRDKALKPERLPELDARGNQIARLLLRIADLAGDHWPVTARAGLVEIIAGDFSSPRSSAGIELLTAIRDIFDRPGVCLGGKVSSKALAEALNDDRALSYGNWNNGNGISTRELGWKLQAYRIKAKTIRTGDGFPKGYEREQFEDAWKRYCMTPEEVALAETADW